MKENHSKTQSIPQPRPRRVSSHTAPCRFGMATIETFHCPVDGNSWRVRVAGQTWHAATGRALEVVCRNIDVVRVDIPKVRRD